MKVITWNLGYWQHQRTHYEAWRYLREEIRPDVALLQEVKPSQLHGDEHLLLNRIHRDWGTALYARHIPIDEIAFEHYPVRVVAARLTLPEDRTMIAVSIHTPIIHSRVFPYLDEIFDEIESIVSNQTFVVGGDLNTARLAEQVWPNHGHGPFFKRLEQSIFFDCVQKFHDTEVQTYFRDNSKYPFQDDHLFVSHDLADKVQTCDVLKNTTTLRLSDHIPVVAEIEMSM